VGGAYQRKFRVGRIMWQPIVCPSVLIYSGDSQTCFLLITVSWQGRVIVFMRGPIIQKREPWEKIIYSII